jgi:hypothetical protein
MRLYVPPLGDEMLRPILALFWNSNFTRAILVPFLLICLACATPFPFESLGEGMTAEAVHDEFGAPIATDPNCLTYWHESQRWFFIFFPLTPLLIPIIAAMEGIPLSEAAHFSYVRQEPVLIDFDAEGLTKWELVKTITIGSECDEATLTYGPDPDFIHRSPGQDVEDTWHWEGGDCTERTASWPKTPTCTRVRAIQEYWK